MPAKQQQYNVVIASFLGWTIDAFDFFLLDLRDGRHREGVRLDRRRS